MAVILTPVHSIFVLHKDTGHCVRFDVCYTRAANVITSASTPWLSIGCIYRDHVRMGLANERQRYNVTSSPIGWAHTQYYPWFMYVNQCNANIEVSLSCYGCIQQMKQAPLIAHYLRKWPKHIVLVWGRATDLFSRHHYSYGTKGFMFSPLFVSVSITGNAKSLYVLLRVRKIF